MDKKEKENLADTNKREINRNLAANAAENRIIQNKKIPTTPPRRKSSSNPQQSSKTPPREKINVETIKKRMKQNMPSNKIFIKINKPTQEWYVEEEKKSNYYIKDGKIYNKRGKLTKYIYTEKDGLGLKTNNQIIHFFKTEKLKKE